MGKDDHFSDSSAQPDNNAGDNPSSASMNPLEVIDRDLVKINAIMELFCRKLGDVLPGISLEIFHTYQRATETLDSLTSDTPPGLVYVGVNLLSKILEDTESLVNEEKARDDEACKEALDICEKINQTWQSLSSVHDSLTSAGKRLSPNIKHNPDYEAAIESSSYRTEKIKKNLEAINAFSSELKLKQKDAEKSAHECLYALDKIGRKGVFDLANTFKTVIVIFKDLIDRSNATKKAFLTVMTSLQVHDIVRQDIENVLKALQCVRRNESGEQTSQEHKIFQQKTCTLSGRLLEEISHIIIEHAGLITREINLIQKIVSNVKNDKDNLYEFLLVNDEQESTLDSAISEVAVMMDVMTDRLQELVKKRELMHDNFPRLHEQVATLDHFLNETAQYHMILTDALSQPDQQSIQDLKVTIASLKAYLTELKSDELRDRLLACQDMRRMLELTASVNTAKEDINKDLNKIKRLIINSIDGINNYANRCMGAIRRFRRRMEKLSNNLQAITDIATKIKSYSHEEENAEAENNRSQITEIEIRESEMAHLLSLLTNPHIRTLAKKPDDTEDENNEDSLTLF